MLSAPPPRIDIKFLEQYPEFLEFQRPKSQAGEPTAPALAQVPDLETPEETLEAAHAKMKAVSRSDAGQTVGRAGDEGIDGLISEDRLGLDVVYLQAKRWEGSVGRPEIQKFVGALHGKRAKKGVFITSGSFSSEATAYVEHIDPKVVPHHDRSPARVDVMGA